MVQQILSTLWMLSEINNTGTITKVDQESNTCTNNNQTTPTTNDSHQYIIIGYTTTTITKSTPPQKYYDVPQSDNKEKSKIHTLLSQQPVQK